MGWVKGSDRNFEASQTERYRKTKKDRRERRETSGGDPKIRVTMMTWDGGGAHANSRWSEELVRTERERERECVHYSRTVWHGERDTESLARYFYLKNRSHWQVPVSRGNRARLGVIR